MSLLISQEETLGIIWIIAEFLYETANPKAREDSIPRRWLMGARSRWSSRAGPNLPNPGQNLEHHPDVQQIVPAGDRAPDRFRFRFHGTFKQLENADSFGRFLAEFADCDRICTLLTVISRSGE